MTPEADTALELPSKEEAYTSLRTIGEATFVLLKFAMKKHYGIRGAYDLRRALKKYDLNPVKEELEALRNFIEESGIKVLPDVATLEGMEDVILKYKVLPEDAVRGLREGALA